MRYPTQGPILEILNTLLKPAPGCGSALDMCCARGEALATLKPLGFADTWGNELQSDIKEAGPVNLDHWAHGPAEFYEIDGLASFTLCNPPYDYDPERGRQEIKFLEMAIRMLAAEGVIVAIVPLGVARNYEFSNLFTKHFTSVVARRYPAGLFEEFNQVVIFGTKRSRPDYSGDSFYFDEGAGAADLQIELAANAFSYPIDCTARIKQARTTAPSIGDTLALIEKEGLWTAEALDDFVRPPLLTVDFQPAQPLRVGFVPLLIANGMMTCVELKTPEGRLLVRGYSEKEVIHVETEDTEDKTVDIEREVMPIRIVTFNLDDGTFKTYDSREEPTEFEAFVTTNLDALYEWTVSRYQPRYAGDPAAPGFWQATRWAALLSQIHSPQKTYGIDGDGLLGGQAETAVALLENWQRGVRVGILSGEKGTGKTLTASATYAAWAGRQDWNRKLVVMCPGNVVPKWAREFEAALKHFGAWSVQARSVIDVDAAFARPGPGLIVFSLETGKNGSGWGPAFNEKTVLQEDRDPRTNRRIKRIVKLKTCPTCGEVIESDAFLDTASFCSDCGGALFTMGEANGNILRTETTVVPGRKQLAGGFRRYPLAEYISQHYARQYVFILDEAHRAKGGQSQQGWAAYDLIVNAQRSLIMTGTLYGGKASTLYYLLYRALPYFRSLYAHDAIGRFIQHYGLYEIFTTRRKQRNTYRAGYSYDDENVKYKEIPGCNPGLVSLLLPVTAFLSLKDLGIVLPPRQELVMPVAMLPEQKKVYDGVLNDLYEEAARNARKGGTAALASWMQAAIGWLDWCEAETLHVTFRDGTSFVTKSYAIAGVNLAEVGELPKVTAVCDDIAEEWKRGRRSLVFFEQVNRRDPIPMWEKALRDRGLKPWVLRQNTKPEDREDAFRRAVAAGFNVSLMNGTLVETGMDLIECKNIYRVQPNFSPYKVDQQNGRVYRLGQDQEIRIVYPYYTGTIQQSATYLMADKLAAIAIFNGEVAEGLAALSSSGDSFVRELQRVALQKTQLNRPTTVSAISEGVTPVVRQEAIVITPGDDLFNALLVAEARPTPSPAAVPVTYTVRHRGLGIIEVRNGDVIGECSWLGGEEVYGASESVLAIVRRANLAKQKTRAKWQVEVTVQ